MVTGVITSGSFRPEAKPLGDDEILRLNDVEAADAAELDLVKVYKPNERVFNNAVGPRPDERFDATFTAGADQSDWVEIYDARGYAFPMTRDLAIVRLRKRDPITGERVFFTRRPVDPPQATLPCLKPGCRKRFHDRRSQRRHFETRHNDDYKAAEEEKRVEREERAIALQEAQVAQGRAMTELLARLAGGQTVDPEAVAEVIEKVAAPVVTIPEDDGLDRLTKEELKGIADDYGIDYGANPQNIAKGAWVNMIRAYRAEAQEE